MKGIVVLTGAGISAESGIPVFRSETGLWEQERIEDVCVPSALVKNPQKVHDFYNKMRRSLKEKKPNEGHLALAKLQEECKARGVKFTLVTQNIDDLHEKAGSEDIIHMHGFLNSLLCPRCGGHFPFFEDSRADMTCKKCNKGILRPDIVFFEEIPYFLDEIAAALEECSLFMSAGTSGAVYPAAGFVRLAKRAGAHAVEFNLEPSKVNRDFDEGIYESASKSLPKFCKELLKRL